VDGYFRLTGVPAGTAQLRAAFTGFPSATASVTVAAGQTLQRDFQLAPLTSAGAKERRARPSSSMHLSPPLRVR
jgi:hypothetical protein